MSSSALLLLNATAAEIVLGGRVQWDAENRLVGIVQASGTTGFVYDGAGHRVQETLNGNVIKQWVWCSSQPCEERDGSGNVTKRFYAQGEQISGVSYYFTRDHLGSVREMTDSIGAIRAQYDYGPYGRVTKISGDLNADFGFTGDYYHAATGLSLTMYRAYDPNLGRWLSRDPIGENGGLNLYRYVGNSPLDGADPLGLDTYFINRDLSAFGQSAQSRSDPVTHTFVVTTNPDGSVNHTYSWGNDANLKGWNLDQPLDVETARQALANGSAESAGDSSLDSYVAGAFSELNKTENEHMNLMVLRNCKTEAHKLVNTARLDQFSSEVGVFIRQLFNIGTPNIGGPQSSPSYGPPAMN